MNDPTPASSTVTPWHLWLVGVLGAVLLLLRKRWAVPVFGISLVTMALTPVYNFVLTNGLEVMDGLGGLIFSAVIFAIAVALLIYARSLARIGVLR